jgi:diguanylate cyclase (GGDEF)-like protein
MGTPSVLPAITPALRQARKAWKLQYRDSGQSIALADRALERATRDDDVAAEGWARLTRGCYRMRHDTPAEGTRELALAQACFAAAGESAGQVLAAVGTARCWWIQGRFRDARDLVLPLRDEGLERLKHEERGMLLNTIAGCYSSMGQSAEAFAYLYQALRESSPARGHGFDVALYTNLAHELFQLGDYAEALKYIEEGIERCARLNNPYMLSVLLINRVICLTDLGRPHDALEDVRRLQGLPATTSGRGSENAGFETMAIAALRAGETDLGEQLVEHATVSLGEEATPDEQIELIVATVELLIAHGELDAAVARMERALPLPAEGLGLRVACLFYQTLADLCERIGDAPRTLVHLRAWQSLHIERAERASRARVQAASLQTELMRLQHARDEIDARRRATERARAELEAINQQLSHKMREVESLRAALEQQAVRDFLTGLFNRRHLNNVLPSMHALAQRGGEPLSLAIIDLDHFKDVNDRYGHDAGDMLLAAFGDLLIQRMRKSDVACRYGGEEFCVLMPRTDAQAARRKLEKLLGEWSAMIFPVAGGLIASNTFSAGVTDSRAVPGSVDHLLKAADNSVLEAKRLGRSQILVVDAVVRERANEDLDAPR